LGSYILSELRYPCAMYVRRSSQRLLAIKKVLYVVVGVKSWHK